MKIVIAGATGFVGRALTGKLSGAGHEVFVLTRSARKVVRETGGKTLISWDGPCPGFSKRVDKDRPHYRFAVIDQYWDGKTLGDWTAHLDGADAVINLTGENIAAKRWTPSQKQKILSSRIDATRVIVNAIGLVSRKPALLINVSAVGYYGDAADRELTEASAQGAGFLAKTCGEWEAEARKAELFGARVILARLGPVLGEKGGMLSRMIPPFRFFIGAPMGTGKQWIPWVHRDDVTGAFLFMLEHGDLSGPVNVTSGTSVTMQEFCRRLASILRRPCWPPLPSFFLRVLMGEMAAIVLSSQKAIPQKLLKAGYRFRYPDLAAAFAAILKASA